MVANLVLVNAIGVDTLLRGAGAKKLSPNHLTPELVGVYAARSLMMIIGVLTISVVLWIVLRIFRQPLLDGNSVKYLVALTICSYAAYAREVLRLIITFVVVLWHHILKVPLTSGQAIQINIAAFLRGPVSRPLFILARSLDVLMLGFLGLITVGLWKVVPNLPIHRAASVTVVTWLIYLGLSLFWGR
jgi:hypothetical protein